MQTTAPPLFETRAAGIFTALDPRMALLILIFFATVTYVSSNNAVLLWYDLLIILLYILKRRWSGALKTALLFGSFFAAGYLIGLLPSGTAATALGMILFFAERLSVLFVLSAWMTGGLKISDFLAALQQMHLPKGLIVTVAVALRYLPTVRTECRAIRNTMKLRQIEPSLKNILRHPIRTGEYALVPLIIRSMTIADELSASAMTRGLDLKTRRTSYREIRMKVSDIAVTAAILLLALGGLYTITRITEDMTRG